MKYTKGDLYNFFDEKSKKHITDFFKNKKEKYNKYTTVEINRLQWEEDCEEESKWRKDRDRGNDSFCE